MGRLYFVFKKRLADGAANVNNAVHDARGRKVGIRGNFNQHSMF